MEELVVQSDGTFALCFKNFNNIRTEEVDSIFKEYGDVVSIRQSSEANPWVFIRYKHKEEAQKALDDLQGYKDFQIRIAKSYAKKKHDQIGGREKSDCFSEESRDDKSVKGVQSRNRGSERFVMDSEDNDSFVAKKVPYNNWKRNNVADRPYRNNDGNSFNHSDRVSEPEGARAISPNREMASSKPQRISNGKNFNGRELKAGVRESMENSRRSIDDSPPRLVKKSPRSHGVNGAVGIERPGDGPPNLVKGSEFYANSLNMADSTTRGLAMMAAREEVWQNHPLHSEMTLREVIISNFEYLPSRKDIYELCSPVKPLHVSFGVTQAGSIFSRVLVATEKEEEELLMLHNEEELYFTTLEGLLDVLYLYENGE